MNKVSTFNDREICGGCLGGHGLLGLGLVTELGFCMLLGFRRLLGFGLGGCQGLKRAMGQNVDELGFG